MNFEESSKDCTDLNINLTQSFYFDDDIIKCDISKIDYKDYEKHREIFLKLNYGKEITHFIDKLFNAWKSLRNEVDDKHILLKTSTVIIKKNDVSIEESFNGNLKK